MFKRLLILMIPIFLASLPLSGQQSFTYGKQILEISDELTQFYPREENSENERLLFQYLEQQFLENEIDFQILDYSESESAHSFSQGYSASIQGERSDTLIIAIPLNSKRNQRSDSNGTVNIAIAIQLLRIFTQFKPPVSIEFLFLGAERGSDSVYPIGSNLYLSSFTETSPTIALYLDMDKSGSEIIIQKSSDNDKSPLWYLRSLSNQFSSNSLIFSTDSIETFALQSGMEKASPILQTYLERDVPLILLESENELSSQLPDDQWLNAFVESLLAFILEYKGGFPEDWDRHYLAGVFQGRLLTLGEKAGLSLTIVITAILLLILLLKSRNLHLNLKRFRSHLWTFPLLLFLIFLFLFLSTLIIEEISTLRDYPDFWRESPILFLLFKAFLAMFLYSSFLYLIRGISLSPSHHFYTYSAFASVIISMITVTIVNISFSYFLLWSLLGVTLFMITRQKMIKRIAIFLTPLPLLIICYRIFTEPFFEISNYLLVSRVGGNIFFTIIITPTLMLFSSLTHFVHRFHRHRRSLRSMFSIGIWAFLSSLVLYQIVMIKEFDESNLQPLFVSEDININDVTRSIEINSPAPIGSINLNLEENRLKLSDLGRNAQITAPVPSDLMSVKRESSSFLDRLSLFYSIDAIGRPDKISIEMTSDESMIIFDSNYPSRMSADGKTVIFFIGLNPPMPLNLEIILPQNLTPTLNIRLDYTDLPYQFSLVEKHFQLFKNMSLYQKIDWID